MDKTERKTLEVFVIVIASFYTMIESPEAKKEFSRILQRMILKAEE
ncbi:MAG: hypothetical protein ABSF65_02020 [Candidatus Bathyarchaeia archaeon]|jgi:hypothetical protein